MHNNTSDDTGRTGSQHLPPTTPKRFWTERLTVRQIRDDGYLPNCPKMFGIRFPQGEIRRAAVDPGLVEIIRFTYNKVLEHKSLNDIAREVNRLYSDHFTVRPFHVNTLRSIITQPFYCGFMYDSQRELIPAKQMEGQEVISFSTWQRANEIIRGQKSLVPSLKAHAPLFKGIMRCGYCGKTLTASQMGDDIHYQCLTQPNDQQVECGLAGFIISQNKQGQAWTGLRQALSPLLTMALFKTLDLQDELPNLDDARAEILFSISGFEKRLNEAIRHFSMTSDSSRSLDGLKTIVEEKISRLRQQLQVLDRTSAYASEECHRCRQILANIDDLMADRLDDQLYGNLLRRSIRSITCYRDHIGIDTIYGYAILSSHIEGQHMTFPTFTYEILPPDGLTMVPHEAQIHVCYPNRVHPEEHEFAYLGQLTIYA